MIMVKGRNRDEDPAGTTSAAGFDNIISGNTIHQTQDIGIKTTGIHITMDGCLVTSNHIVGTFRGIAVKPLTNHLIISANMIYGLNHYGTNEYIAGINLNAPNNCQVLDNQIANMSSDGVCYGIYIQSGGESYDGCLIEAIGLMVSTPRIVVYQEL